MERTKRGFLLSLSSLLRRSMERAEGGMRTRQGCETGQQASGFNVENGEFEVILISGGGEFHAT